MTHGNKLQVEAIKRGTVIDHIPAQVGIKLLTLFKLTETDQRITIGLNLPSGEMGRKDLIKIENTFLTDEQVNQLSLYAPDATVNRIDEYEVVGKSRPSLPDRIDSVLVCPNSNCIKVVPGRVEAHFAVVALHCRNGKHAEDNQRHQHPDTADAKAPVPAVGFNQPAGNQRRDK
mgnify:CR=1 FL=1